MNNKDAPITREIPRVLEFPSVPEMGTKPRCILYYVTIAHVHNYTLKNIRLCIILIKKISFRLWMEMAFGDAGGQGSREHSAGIWELGLDANRGFRGEPLLGVAGWEGQVYAQDRDLNIYCALCFWKECHVPWWMECKSTGGRDDTKGQVTKSLVVVHHICHRRGSI